MRDIATFPEALFDFVLWVALFLVLSPVLRKPYVLSNRRRYFAYLLLLVFCLFPFFGGDYFHYIEIFNDTRAGYVRGLEDVYKWIINTGVSYTVFRLIIWGVALILTISAYNRVHRLSNLSVAFFGLLYLPWFSYARASLAMAMIFYGLCLLSDSGENKKFWRYVIGFLMLACSFFFHRTAPIGVAAAMGALLLKNPSKKSLILILLAFPLMVLALKTALSEFMNFDLDYDSLISEKQRDAYLGDTDGSSGGLKMGIGPYIMVFFSRAPLFLVGFLYVFSVLKGYIKDFHPSVKIVSSYCFIIILIAFAFSLDLGFNTYVFYYRTLNFAMIPSALFLSQIRFTGKCPVLYKVIYLTSLFGIFYTLVYTIYCSMV